MALNDIDITKNIKMIEWLKSELLTSVAGLFSTLLTGFKETTQDAISSSISNIIIVAYLLAKRLGIGFMQVDLKVENKLKLGIEENHELEKSYGDLSELLKHFELGHIKREAEL